MITTQQQHEVCRCNNCSSPIEFDAVQVGQTVQCPHCQMETVLYIPVRPQPERSSLTRRIIVWVIGGILILSALFCIGFMVGGAIRRNPDEVAQFPAALVGMAILAGVLIIIVAWVLFPILVYTQLSKANKLLDLIERNTHVNR